MSIIDNIKSQGYWEVIIRPKNHSKDRIKTLTDCKDIIFKNKVSIRGWDFPFLNKDKTKSLNEYISSEVNFNDIKEYWRYYLSGQFIYLGATREDYMLEKIIPIARSNIYDTSNIDFKNQKFFVIEILIHKVYEIFEFALRLCSKDLLNDSFIISIKLFKMQNRVLNFFQRDRMMHSSEHSNSDIITFEKEFYTNSFINNYKVEAINCINHVFERFDFNLSEEIIREIQPNLK